MGQLPGVRQASSRGRRRRISGRPFLVGGDPDWKRAPSLGHILRPPPQEELRSWLFGAQANI
eukprot:4100904-Pyramimonas_sp.AAC.1